jgi:hypothetical protein
MGGSHRWKIGTLLLITATLMACSRQQRFGVATGPTPATQLMGLPPLAPGQLLYADRSGVSPPDTVVGFAGRMGRTVVLRHAPPDNAIFAILHIPADSTASDSVTVTLRVTPGRYGLLVLGEPRLPAGTALTFSMAIHFQAPPEIPSAAYPSTTRYAAWLGVGRVMEDGTLRYHATTRPGADLLRIVVTAPGEYLVAAPVTPP